MVTLARELQDALDDQKRYEWGDGPWEHLGDAERDVRLLLAGIFAMEEALEAADSLAGTYGRCWAKDGKFYAYQDARDSLRPSKESVR